MHRNISDWQDFSIFTCEPTSPEDKRDVPLITFVCPLVSSNSPAVDPFGLTAKWVFVSKSRKSQFVLKIVKYEHCLARYVTNTDVAVNSTHEKY